MDKFFKTNKRGIITILALFILLNIFGSCLNVTAMAEETIIVTEGTTQELVPMMASDCGYNLPEDFLNGGR